jgi:adenine-specific DNA-methyltransferase
MKDKKELLIETFNHSFNLQNFVNFVQELFKGNARFKNNLEFSPKVKGEFKAVVREFLELGWYKDKNSKSMAIVVVRLERENSVARSRSMQRNFIKDYFLKNDTYSALVAFYNKDSADWRLSFVKLDYSYKNAKTEKELTPAKRYSFLLGKNEKHHTAISRFLPVINNNEQAPTIKEIEEVFNIEVVTNEFFELYCDLYLEIKKCLDKQEEFNKISKKLDFKSDEFSKKLMGQLVFLYFLQKKGWLGVEANPKEIKENEAISLLKNKNYESVNAFEKVYELGNGIYKRNESIINTFNDEEAIAFNNIFMNTSYDGNWGSGDRNFIRNLYNKVVNEKKNFYKDYLEHLFYNALNDKRGGSTFFKELNCKIPFLNGGLFQPISENYDPENSNFIIPNEIFSNKEKTQQGDIGNGILDIFDRYAFTVKEDEPLEKEVAVDPEMLGKVFENLLDVVDRKKKGAFYTPREIVHYMCQESIINYLTTETGIEYNDVETLIRYGDVLVDIDNDKEAYKTGNFQMPATIRKNSKRIDDALANIKIADPAVGSGAFPLGMLNEIVRTRMNLTQYMVDDIYAVHRDFTNVKGRKPYDLKLHTIQRCIHAVDIERSAVDITKLRLWLSLVVEENDFRNVKPLPNLDYNIMVGNSLLEEFEGVKLFNEKLLEKKNNDLIKETFAEQIGFFDSKKESEYILDDIYDLQEKFFSANNKEEKIKLRDEIDKLEWILIEMTVKENNREDLLPKIKELKRTNTKPYFLWELNFAKTFREKGGFDIVIGNPPYVGEKGNKEIFRPIANSELGKRFYQGKMDLFYFFFHKGIDILKNTGILAFITTDYYITATGAKKLRSDFKERTNVIKIIDFNELKIFESALGQHNMITILNKTSCKIYKANTIFTKKVGFGSYEILRNILNGKDNETFYNYVKQEDLYDGSENYMRIYTNTISSNNSLLTRVIDKIKYNSKLLGYICNINSGADITISRITKKHIENFRETGISYGDGVFVVSPEYIRELDLNRAELSVIKDFVKNSDISQYNIRLNKDKLIYLKWEDDIEKYPKIKKHLEKYKEILIDQVQRYGENYPWYALHRPREQKIFECTKKILVPYRSKFNVFGYYDKPVYASRDVFFITDIENQFDIRYLLGILNSKLYYVWFYLKGKRKGETLELYQTPLSEAPIKAGSKLQQLPIIQAVDKVLAINNSKQEDKDMLLYYYKIINNLVYKLYDLSPEEIEAVENFNK